MSSEIQQKLTITLSLVDFEFQEFILSRRTQELDAKLNVDKYEFQFDLRLNINEVDKLAVMPLRIFLYEKEAVSKIELAQLAVISKFKLLNYEEVIKKDDQRISFPNQLIHVTSGVTISTARGIFLMCAKGTMLENALIPMIDTKIFTEADDQIVKEIEKVRSK